MNFSNSTAILASAPGVQQPIDNWFWINWIKNVFSLIILALLPSKDQKPTNAAKKLAKKQRAKARKSESSDNVSQSSCNKCYRTSILCEEAKRMVKDKERSIGNLEKKLEKSQKELKEKEEEIRVLKEQMEEMKKTKEQVEQPVGESDNAEIKMERALISQSNDDKVESTQEQLNQQLDSECVICSDEMDFERKEELFKCPACKKVVHSDCIDEWFTKSKSCPCCRDQWY